MSVNISNLPKNMQRQPHVRGASLIVYPQGSDWLVVGGKSPHTVRRSADPKRLLCDCDAAVSGTRCSHRWAVHYFLQNERKERSQHTQKKEVSHG